MLVVYTTVRLTDAQAARIAGVDPAIRLIRGDREASVPGLDEAEVLFGWLGPEQFRSARRLRWIHAHGAGVDRLLFPELVASDVVVTNARGVAAVSLAEHCFALLLALTRRIPEFVHQQARRQWQMLWGTEIAGQTLGIIGLGNVGRQIARRAHGFDLRVLAVDLRPVDPPPEVAALWPVARLPDLLREVDILVMAAPHTRETDRLLGRAEFARLRPGALFLNISRGKTVDEPALIEALASGHLGGAGLDVTAEEPLPPESPLWSFPNVLITSHSATTSQHFHDRMVDLFVENLRRRIGGEPLLNVVDKQAGF